MNGDSMALPMTALTVVAMVLLATAVTRAVLARQRAAARIVEKPNSDYTWQAVREREAVGRWQGIDLDSLHEINREEVKRLLAVVETAGADALRPTDRRFLDALAG